MTLTSAHLERSEYGAVLLSALHLTDLLDIRGDMPVLMNVNFGLGNRVGKERQAAAHAPESVSQRAMDGLEP